MNKDHGIHIDPHLCFKSFGVRTRFADNADWADEDGFLIINLF